MTEQVTELHDVLTQLAALQPFKYQEVLQTFERNMAAGTLTAADVNTQLSYLRPLATHLVRTYRAMTRGKGTLV